MKEKEKNVEVAPSEVKEEKKKGFSLFKKKEKKEEVKVEEKTEEKPEEVKEEKGEAEVLDAPVEEKVEEVKEEVPVEEPKIDKDKAIKLINGEYEKDVEFVNILPSKLNDNAYLIYTKNEKDETGNIILYLSIIRLGEEGLELIDITNEDEYQMLVKEINEITGEANGQ